MEKAQRTVLRTRALIQKEGHFLLAQLGTIYFLPGGRLEPGESLRCGITRELQEEAGVAPTELRFVGIHEQEWKEKGELIHEINFMFTATLPLSISESPILTNDEGVLLQWVREDQLSGIDLRPKGIVDKFKGQPTGTLWAGLI